MNSVFWVLIVLMDDGTGQFKYTQQYSQYHTKEECIIQRDTLNAVMTNVRAECYQLKATKVK
jgi:hypothetical protein